MSDAVENTNPNPVDPTGAAAPAASPAPAPAPTEGDQGGEEHVDDLEGQQPQQGRRPIQPRINELTRARHEAEREAAYWRGIAEAKGALPQNGQQASAPAPAAEQTPPKPSKADFQTYDDYVEALTDWKAANAVREAKAAAAQEAQRTLQARETAQQQQKQQSTWVERVQSFRSNTPDWDDVIASGSNTPIKPHVGEMIRESDLGPQLLYKFAKEPQLLEQLNGLSERAAAKQIGVLEAQLAASAPAPSPTSAAAPPAPAAQVSKAPVPPRPVGAAPANATAKDPSKMSMAEYVAWRKTQPGLAFNR